MKIRVYSTVVMILLLILLVYIAPIEFGIIFMVLASGQVVREILAVSQNSIIKKHIKAFSAPAILLPVLIYFTAPIYVELYIVFVTMCLMLIYLRFHEHLDYKDVTFLIFGMVIIPVALNFITKIYLMKFGQYLILIPMITAWCSDIFAYLFGRTFGKHKLAPKISPNKTIEGSIGGMFGATVGMIIFGYFTNQFIDIPMIFLIMIGISGSIVGQLGDLSFSMIKRQTGIKDYSNLIPGHGGILDRFDSIMFTAPIAYMLLSII